MRGNNPVIYIDPDGEFPWLFVAALVLGAGTNVASNWDAITQNGFNWGKFVASAVVGAGSSALDFLGPLGWAGGGFLSGFGNTLIQDGDFGDAIKFGITGSVTGTVSGYAGRFVDQNLASPLINGLSIESPVVKGLVGGAVGGLVIGGTMGVVFGEGDLGDRFKDGAISGALLGGVTGTISAGLAAHEAGYDPFTGNPYNSGTKYSGYQGIDSDNNVRYVGITKRDPNVRFDEHYKSIGTGKELLIYKEIRGAKFDTELEARICEQMKINKYGLGKNKGLLLNKINSIAPKYWMKHGIPKPTVYPPPKINRIPRPPWRD